MKGKYFMKFRKSRKVCIAAALCAMLMAGQTVLAAQAANGSWTAARLSVQSEASFLEGTVEDFAVDDKGNTVWMVRKTGDAADAPLVGVTVGANTKLNFEGNVANGDIIGVEYRGEGTIQALTVTKHTPLPAVTAAGQVIELLPASGGSDGGFLLRQAGEAGDIIFHYGSDTKIMTPDKTVKVGDRLSVTYNGVLTRSMPPQGYAQVITAQVTAAQK